MIIYKDILSGDELMSDSYDIKENGMFLQVGSYFPLPRGLTACDACQSSHKCLFLQVDGKWITVGDVDVDIGANPSQGARLRPRRAAASPLPRRFHLTQCSYRPAAASPPPPAPGRRPGRGG